MPKLLVRVLRILDYFDRTALDDRYVTLSFTNKGAVYFRVSSVLGDEPARSLTLASETLSIDEAMHALRIIGMTPVPMFEGTENTPARRAGITRLSFTTEGVAYW